MEDFPIGKISPSLFHDIIYPALGNPNPKILVGPNTGMDMAIVRVGQEDVLVTSTDPVVIRPELGWHDSSWFAVQVVASDVAVSGIMPQVMTFSLVLPASLAVADLKDLWQALSDACHKEHIQIANVRLMYSDYATFPVVGAATAIAQGHQSHYITPADASLGDEVLCTKGAAIQATAILARLFSTELRTFLSAEETFEAQSLFEQIGVLQDVRILLRHNLVKKGVSTMHDATEGGILGAVYEIAVASDLGVELDADNIFVYPVTKKIFDHYNIDPLSVISEGTLVMTARSTFVPIIQQVLEEEGILCQSIGRMTDKAHGRWITQNNMRKPLYHPGSDPYWRLMSTLRQKSLHVKSRGEIGHTDFHNET
ncbi:AIR synthase-related protein [Sulfobacillus thermosulfidooxidans]|uniref:AIR synthase-related protein n=1 Tax=Sulfobacillus thermosulfidooxidans TaxID=28034 RepID=UPI0002F80CB6|nr:AIR synthase-related protein [Sulfobacillus thermosulfidooxidans]